jgi:hypothetical protein
MTQHKNKITCFAASKLNKFVKQENFGRLFYLSLQSNISLIFFTEKWTNIMNTLQLMAYDGQTQKLWN